MSKTPSAVDNRASRRAHGHRNSAGVRARSVYRTNRLYDEARTAIDRLRAENKARRAARREAVAA